MSVRVSVSVNTTEVELSLTRESAWERILRPVLTPAFDSISPTLIVTDSDSFSGLGFSVNAWGNLLGGYLNSYSALNTWTGGLSFRLSMLPDVYLDLNFSNGSWSDRLDDIAIDYSASGIAEVQNAWNRGVDFTGGRHDDRITGSRFDDLLDGLWGDDTIRGGEGRDRLLGGRDPSKPLRDAPLPLSGDDDRNLLYGGDGHDQLYAGWGQATLNGGSGSDLLDFRQAGGVAFGGDGDDMINFPSDANAYGGSGQDWLGWGRNVNLAAGTHAGGRLGGIEHVVSATGRIFGSEAANVLDAWGVGSDPNLVRGYGGNDWMAGRGGFDTIEGGRGNDTMWGGASVDTITGGLGADVFILDYSYGARVPDRLTDFQAFQDDVWILRTRVPELAVGALPDRAFHLIGSGPAPDAARLLYDRARGELWLDVSSRPSETPSLLARLQPGTLLRASDVRVVEDFEQPYFPPSAFA